MLRSAFASAALAVFALAPLSFGQACGTGETHWKNDKLPDVPSGAVTISVIPGLCEGEACAAVFNYAPGTPAQKVNTVRIGFGHTAGVNGAVALVDVEIYDGITWAGSIPTLGPLVYDSGALGVNYQISTTAINEIDLSAANVVVSGSPTKTGFVVAFRMGFNPNGSCAAGYNSNFVTDWDGSGAPCSPTKKNLIDISGQGWRDAAVATVSGFPLCPLFYAGNWVIRACTETASICQTDFGFGGPGNTQLTVCGQALSTGHSATLQLVNATPSTVGIVFASIFQNPTFAPPLGGTLVPIPVMLSVNVPIDATGKFVSPVPGGNGPFSIYTQFVTPDPTQVKGYEVSNCVKISILP